MEVYYEVGMAEMQNIYIVYMYDMGSNEYFNNDMEYSSDIVE